MIALLASLLAPALAADLPPPTDLDGDGTPEAFSRPGDGQVLVGAATQECWGDSFPCEVELHDVRADDGRKEVALCWTGPRGYRTCTLYRYAGGALTELPLKRGDQALYPEAVRTTGSGIVRTTAQMRLYTRHDKFVAQADGALQYVQQAGWAVDRAVPINRKAALTRDPGGGPAVATLTPGKPVTLLVESCDKPGHFLVRSSSGLVGWIHVDALQRASDEVMAIYGAG